MKGYMLMSFYLKGVKVPHKKNTAKMNAVRMPIPSKVCIPMSMHIGAPCVPVVKKGDTVKVGSLIGEPQGFVSSPIYSSVSGTVASVDEILLSNGRNCPAVVIESDGEMTLSDDIKPPVVSTKEEMIVALKNSGIVGLGGAGFPTFVKFATDKEIEQLVINGAECEPYITSDSITMVNNADDISYAVDKLVSLFGIKKVVIGIEANKPEAISVMQDTFATNPLVEIKKLPSLYPQGGEKVLVYHTTRKVIPMGKLPIDVGVVVSNSTTIATIGKYLKTGIPLVEKCLTVDGSAVAKPQNIIAPIGTSLKDVFDFCGGFKSEPLKILYGGPMMGITVKNLEAPIIKNTNAILAFDKIEGKEPKTTACIKCGACANNCPFGINPTIIAKAKKNNDIEGLIKAGTELCMECGCCSFVCPAKRPIVQNNRLAKAMIKNAKQKEDKK